MVRKTLAAIALCFLIVSQPAVGEDRITLKSGKTISGKILEYHDGILRIRTPAGNIRKGKMSRVKKIDFDAEKTSAEPSRHSAPQRNRDDVLTAADVVKNVGKFEGQRTKVVGYVDDFESPMMDKENFTIVLDSGLFLNMRRDSFESQYLEIKDLPQSYGKYKEIRYSVRFNFKSFDKNIKLRKYRNEAEYYEDDVDEEKTNERPILTPGTKIKCRGKITKKGRQVIMEKARLLDVE